MGADEEELQPLVREGRVDGRIAASLGDDELESRRRPGFDLRVPRGIDEPTPRGRQEPRVGVVRNAGPRP